MKAKSENWQKMVCQWKSTLAQEVRSGWNK